MNALRRMYTRPKHADVQRLVPQGIPVVCTLRASRGKQPTFAASLTEPGKDTEPVRSHRHQIPYPVRIIGFWMLVFWMLFTLWLVFVIPWWIGVQDHWTYGEQRITQLDANVGHGGISHFLAQYYQGHILLIELPRDPSRHMQVYALPVGTFQTPPVLSLSVKDFNQDGKPDLGIQMEGSIGYVLYNNGSGFQPTPPTN